MRSMHSRGSSPKLWVYLAMERVVQTCSSQEIMDMAPLSRELFPGPVLAPPHPLSFSAEIKVKDGILFKDYCPWHRHRHYQAS